MADGLYGVKQASKTKAKEISSSTSLAFTSNLASLISSSSSKSSPSGRARASKSKSDIFTAHNKSVKKRSAKDVENDDEQKHHTKNDIGGVSASELHRSKRRMEDKVRMYNAMKRGEYVQSGGGYDDRGLVDFDRKWAEQEANEVVSSENSSSENESDNDQELVEFVDEFGRRRKGTKKQAEREERQKRVQALAKEESEQFTARPSAPSNVIYGDAIQYGAYNPDQVIADRMAEVAKKRDKSATPPPDLHFDASAEVRTKGTGFYNFSQDSEDRKREMESLEQSRQETERIRKEREQKKNDRKAELEARKKVIAEQRSKAQAEKFLDDFDIEAT